MRVRSRIALAGLVLFAAIASPLFERVENLVNVPLAAGHETFPMTIVRILPDRSMAGAGQGRTHRTRFILEDPRRVTQHPRLGLLAGALNTRPDLERAELAIEGTRCVYRTTPGAAFPNNRTLDLVRAEGCAPLEGTPTGRVQLTVILRNQARLVLWTHAAPAATVARETMIVDPSPEAAGAEALVVSGRLIDEGPPSARHRRVDLLAYVWQVAPGAGWIWFAVGLGTLAISIGFVELWNPAPEPLFATGRGAAVRGVSAFLLAAGLGVLYAVLTPPFQAPDEPHHFAAFTEIAGRPELMAQADTWAALGHVTRLRFRRAEQFTPSDVGHPDRVWEKQHAPDNSVRGGGVHVMWKGLAPLLGSMTAPRVFFSLRLTNAILLAALIGLFVAVVVRYGQVPSPHLLALPLLLVPTLPFFGMHVSNHAPLIATYVLVAAGLALIVLNRKGDSVSGLLVGAGWALAIALSRSAIPLAPLIAAITGARLLFGPAHGRWLFGWVFWAGLILPLSFVLSMSDAAYVTTSTSLGGAILPTGLQALMGTLARSPWLMAAGIPVLATLEWGLGRLRMRTGRHLRPAARVIARWGAMSAAASVGLLMIGSIFFQYPVLARIDPLNRPMPTDYAHGALWAGLTILRFKGSDYMTSATFWGGFGWLETIPSDWFISLLTGATGLALIGLLIQIARASDTRRAFFLAAAVAGFSGGLAAYALSLLQIAHAISLLKVELAIDLVGRYLFGLYLPMVVICWSGIALIPNGPSHQRLQAAISLGCVLACTGVHAYCLRLLLYRYF